MKKIILTALVITASFLSACSKDGGGITLPLQPQLRQGGTAVNGGSSLPKQCGGFLEPPCQAPKPPVCGPYGCY